MIKQSNVSVDEINYGLEDNASDGFEDTALAFRIRIRIKIIYLNRNK